VVRTARVAAGGVTDVQLVQPTARVRRCNCVLYCNRCRVIVDLLFCWSFLLNFKEKLQVCTVGRVLRGSATVVWEVTSILCLDMAQETPWIACKQSPTGLARRSCRKPWRHPACEDQRQGLVSSADLINI
jgi:hypothetical protein